LFHKDHNKCGVTNMGEFHDDNIENITKYHDPNTIEDISLNLAMCYNYEKFPQNLSNLISLEFCYEIPEDFHENNPDEELPSVNSISFNFLPKILPNLEHLMVREISVVNLKNKWPEMPNLRYLTIENCNLTSLDLLPHDISNIMSLDLSNNQLLSLEGLPSSMDSLENLIIDNNQITSFKGLPKELLKLRLLIINNNKFSQLDGFPQKSPLLSKINLSNNSISSLVDLPKNFDNLLEFVCLNNPLKNLKGLPSNLPNLKILSIKSNNMSNLTGLVSSLPQLNRLLLWGNNLRNLDNFPTNLPKLDTLAIRSTKIKNFKGLPTELPNLRNLSIQENHSLESLHGIPNILPKITHFNISKNPNLSTLEGLPSLPLLIYLTLSENNLETFEHLATDNSKINLIMDHNPIRSFHGLSQKFLEKLMIYSIRDTTPFPAFHEDIIPISIQLLILNRSKSNNFQTGLCKLMELYQASPSELVMHYIKGTNLTEFERKRIFREAGFKERQIMENAGIPLDDPILQHISEKLVFRINEDYNIQI
jgi:Leucine-rich repeat (LRR) protein